MTYQDFLALNEKAKTQTKDMIRFRDKSQKENYYYIDIGDAYRSHHIALDRVFKLVVQGQYYVTNPSFIRRIKMFNPYEHELVLHKYFWNKGYNRDSKGIQYIKIIVEKETDYAYYEYETDYYKGLDGFSKHDIGRVIIDRANNMNIILLEPNEQYARNKFIEEQQYIVSRLQKEMLAQQQLLDEIVK